jgi:hypothetical protein
MHLATLATLSYLVPMLTRAYEIKPFNIDLSSGVPHMKDLIQRTELPSSSVLGSAGAGIDLAWLRNRQTEWLESYDWQKEEDKLNK